LPDSPENLLLRGELAALRTGIIIHHNDPAEIIQEAEEALAYLPKDNLISRARVYMALGTAYAYSNEMQRALETYERGRDLALIAKNPFLATANIELITELLFYRQGRLKDASKNLGQILGLGRKKDGTYQTFTGAAHILLAEINLEWNNFELASRYLEKGFELLQLGGIGYTLTHCYCAAARIKLTFGEIDQALEYLRLATQAAQTSPLMHFQIHLLACQVNLALQLGDVEKALQWVSGEKCELPKTLPSHLREIQQISLAKILLTQGKFTETIEILDEIQLQAESAQRNAYVIDIYLLKALAFQELHKPDTAIENLKNALLLAAPEGYIQKFIEYGKPLQHLLMNTAKTSISSNYAVELLSAFDLQDQPDIAGASVKSEGLVQTGRVAPATSPLIEPLTNREFEVLRLMADGLTYNEIAVRIMVSLNTVRTHVKNIYSKLFVHKRSQAIAKARVLNIL